MAKTAKITIHPNFKIGEIDERLFSAFLEPIGTMVNGTMYNPKHPMSDEQGFRMDFIDMLKSARVPAIRMPGGNFVSAWQWKDSIGPKKQRKVHLDPAWYQYITNDVGHDEYLQWAEKVGTNPLYTINLGTGRIQDAMDIVEYTNHEGGSYWSDLRKKNGHKKPYNVKTWYLGNEMDGPWQLGSWDKDPFGYGVLCQETSKAMKLIDPTIETAVCGSSAPFMEHFPEWDEKVLDQCYDTVDYLSVHFYHTAPPGDLKSLLGGSVYYDDFLNTEAAMIDYVESKHRSPKKVMISLDEYGAMVRPLEPLKPGWGRYNMARMHNTFNPDRKYAYMDPDNMEEHVFPGGDMLYMLSNTAIQLTLLKHADRVKIGCLTMGLHALAQADHDHVWRCAGRFPIMDFIKYAKGTSMQTSVECETFDMPGYAVEDTSQYTGKEGVNYVDAASAWDEEKGTLSIFVMNKNEESEYPLNIDISGFGDYVLKHATEFYSKDLEKKSSFEDECFLPQRKIDVEVKDGVVTTSLKPLSWNVFCLEKNSAI